MTLGQYLEALEQTDIDQDLITSWYTLVEKCYLDGASVGNCAEALEDQESFIADCLYFSPDGY